MKQDSWIFVGLVLTVASAIAQGPATTGAPSVALSFSHLALGAPGLEDDCTILETSAPGAGASINDLRASECQGKAAGTLLQDSDTVELTAAATNPALSLAYADLNANGRYDPGDAVYLDTDPAPGLTPSTSPTAFTLRVLAAADHPAGTYVRAGDSDLVAYGASAATFATASLAWTDPDASATFTAGDVAYILPNGAPGYAAGSLVPQSAIRVSFAPPPSAGATPATPTSSPPTSTPSASTTSASSPTSSPSAEPTLQSPTEAPTDTPSNDASSSAAGGSTLTIPMPAAGLLGTLLLFLAGTRRI